MPAKLTLSYCDRKMAYGLSILKQYNMSFKRQVIIFLGRKLGATSHGKSLGRASYTLRVRMVFPFTVIKISLTHENWMQGTTTLAFVKS